jgi:hypothetical protein
MLLVVGGHARNTGKTALAAGLIRRFRGYGWAAVKITPHGHEGCSRTRRQCGCADGSEGEVALTEEYEPGTTDSGRFLAAGAKRSFLLRVPGSNIAAAAPILRKILDRNHYVIVESNSVLALAKPDLYLMLIDFSCPDFKSSALRYMNRADAFVVVDRGLNIPLWEDLAKGGWESKPCFYVKPPNYLSAALLDFAASRLSPGSAG